jgi:adhesin/invasin
VTLAALPLEVILGQANFQGASGQTLGAEALGAVMTSGLLGAGVDQPAVSGPEAVVNAFSFERALAPGGIATIFGKALADCNAGALGFPLPTNLCETSVMVNGQAAPLYYASPTQLNFQLPGGIAAGQDVGIVVERGGFASDLVVEPGALVAAVAPAIAFDAPDGIARANVSNGDLTINGPDHPLHSGGGATLWADALGPTTPAVADGAAAPANPPATTASPVQVWVNNALQPVSFAGLAAGECGVYRVDFTLSPSTPVNAGDNNAIWLRVNGAESPHLLISLAP